MPVSGYRQTPTGKYNNRIDGCGEERREEGRHHNSNSNTCNIITHTPQDSKHHYCCSDILLQYSPLFMKSRALYNSDHFLKQSHNKSISLFVMTIDRDD